MENRKDTFHGRDIKFNTRRSNIINVLYCPCTYIYKKKETCCQNRTSMMQMHLPTLVHILTTYKKTTLKTVKTTTSH